MVIVVVLVLVATAGRTERATVARGPITLVASEPAPVAEPAKSEEQRLADVERLTQDASDQATDALVAAADDPSLLVAMAGVRALRGRPCARVAGALGHALGHTDWQRRAWAAKVLGDNGCRTATATLRARLAREPDPRVRRQLSGALATLRTAG
jgi:HEAT repeat protein